MVIKNCLNSLIVIEKKFGVRYDKKKKSNTSI